MKMTLFRNRLWSSISFRLTLNYGLLAILTTLILILFIYFQVIGALRTEYARQITATAQRLTVTFEEGGRAALIKAIELTLSDRIDADREIYLLLDEAGRKLAGNLDVLSGLASENREVFEAKVMRDDIPATGHLRILTLSGGETLVVGLDLSEMHDMSLLIGRAIMTAVLLALLLVMLGTYIFRKELEYRVGNIRRTTQQVSAGELSTRIVPSSADDEFNLLNHDINSMLDRIEQLMRSARHISDTIAHNLRTPLTRIMGRLRVAQSPERTPAEMRDAIQYSIDGIENLSVLLGKVLQIAEVEGGVRRQAFKPCDVGAIAADVVDFYEVFAEEKGIVLTHEIQDTFTTHGDANLLASALANLVDNAVKFARTKVEVEVKRTSEVRGCVIVQDDGPGLPSAEYEHLGKHFYRLDPASEGYGLGLTSVLGIVKLHGGELAFSDAKPGLRVTLSFPVLP